ncbi:MAG: HAD-IB family hydrolase [Acidimicrobiia bacterium]|nr:HAD-IB family hydrolase [Acidimicrobiia bacterium]
MDTDRMSAAFFDLDRTLISGSSLYTFGRAAWRNDMVTTGQLLSDLKSAIAFRFSGSTDDSAAGVRDRVLDAIAGTTVEELKALGGQVIPRLVDDVRREAQGFLELHREAGRATYMVTASPIEIVQPLAEELEMTGAIATVAEVVNGVYTGRLSEPFCYGPGKATAIAKLAAEHGYDLALSYGYSDSVSDLPMLELVGHPVAVNPDRELERIARARGWPIVEFSRTAKRVVGTTTAAVGAVGLAAGTYLLGRHHGRLA